MLFRECNRKPEIRCKPSVGRAKLRKRGPLMFCSMERIREAEKAL